MEEPNGGLLEHSPWRARGGERARGKVARGRAQLEEHDDDDDGDDADAGADGDGVLRPLTAAQRSAVGAYAKQMQAKRLHDRGGARAKAQAKVGVPSARAGAPAAVRGASPTPTVVEDDEDDGELDEGEDEERDEYFDDDDDE